MSQPQVIDWGNFGLAAYVSVAIYEFFVPDRRSKRLFIETGSADPHILATLTEADSPDKIVSFFCAHRQLGGNDGILATLVYSEPGEQDRNYKFGQFGFVVVQRGAQRYQPPQAWPTTN